MIPSWDSLTIGGMPILGVNSLTAKGDELTKLAAMYGIPPAPKPHPKPTLPPPRAERGAPSVYGHAMTGWCVIDGWGVQLTGWFEDSRDAEKYCERLRGEIQQMLRPAMPRFGVKR